MKTDIQTPVITGTPVIDVPKILEWPPDSGYQERPYKLRVKM